ncbi:hypothetical protein THAOC_33040 [Thalassiosira oceanica]|uniref:Uncharacterized protein n=1 Tax=Thalassiosira oceanica TaxID=159749 RepID=K0RH43_THAOC|nr:hypothetical protein THAOC_33040 [Thalassiosira oceanica]|eukprot:EJK48186.1 hypothetical protein THAOC_33040 [Thalassiosira oceanica]
MAVTIAKVADLSPLFESLDELPQEALNKGPALYSPDCVSIISSLLFIEEMWEPGQCLLDCLKHFFSKYSCKGHNLFLLELLISHIEECGPVQKLRFAVGDRVECYMGHEQGWQRGKVNSLWARHPDHSFGQMLNPYEVLLDGAGGESGRMIYAPGDTDQCIRLPMEFPPTRFVRGDTVIAITVQGWVEGTIISQWQKHPVLQKWCPYLIEVEDGIVEGNIVSAPEDTDIFVRAVTDNFVPNQME